MKDVTYHWIQQKDAYGNYINRYKVYSVYPKIEMVLTDVSSNLTQEEAIKLAQSLNAANQEGK